MDLKLSKNQKMILQKHKDIFGQAIKSYMAQPDKNLSITVNQKEFDLDTIPVWYLFRKYAQMPIIEQKAMDEAIGTVLDVGCGAGCHSKHLLSKGYSVKGIDISPLAIECLNSKIPSTFETSSILDYKAVEQYDTILLLMNGVGIAENIQGLQRLFEKLKTLLKPNGKILMDSSDLKYLYEEEDGSFLLPFGPEYYGQTQYQLAFKDFSGDWFNWLFIDFVTLCYYAERVGLKCKKIIEGEHYDYLAELTLC